MGLGNWSWDPSLFYVVPAAALYALGCRPKAGRPSALQALAFYAGLLTIVLAVDSPIDAYSDELLWVHMAQHILLLTVAPPLILLGRPWPTMWRALPLGMRVNLAREVTHAPLAAPLRTLARPLAAWVLFNVTIVVWHIPAAYDLTESNGVVHACEHAMFFFFGLLFWARVIDVGPLRPHVEWVARLAYIVGAMIVSWTLAIVFVVAPTPIYAHYADLASRPGGISALTDQQLAGGMMWVAGSLAYTIALFVTLYRWLAPEPPPRPPVLVGSGVRLPPEGPSGHTNGSPIPALPQRTLTT